MLCNEHHFRHCLPPRQPWDSEQYVSDVPRGSNALSRPLQTEPRWCRALSRPGGPRGNLTGGLGDPALQQHPTTRLEHVSPRSVSPCFRCILRAHQLSPIQHWSPGNAAVHIPPDMGLCSLPSVLLVLSVLFCIIPEQFLNKCVPTFLH